MNLPFRSGKYYKHKNSRDHVLYIRKIQFIGDDYCVIKVWHFNPGCTGKGWMMPGPPRYKIPISHYDDYLEVTLEELQRPKEIK